MRQKKINKEQNNNENNILSEKEDENNKENNNNEEKYNDVISNPKGLENLRLNCYMNSLLQFLFYIPELGKYFVEGKESGYFDEEDKSVCYTLSEEMYSMKNGKSKFIRPEKFKKVTGDKNILFSEKKPLMQKIYFSIQ